MSVHTIQGDSSAATVVPMNLPKFVLYVKWSLVVNPIERAVNRMYLPVWPISSFDNPVPSPKHSKVQGQINFPVFSYLPIELPILQVNESLYTWIYTTGKMYSYKLFSNNNNYNLVINYILRGVVLYMWCYFTNYEYTLCWVPTYICVTESEITEVHNQNEHWWKYTSVITWPY